jgi:hypothetical protein
MDHIINISTVKWWVQSMCSKLHVPRQDNQTSDHTHKIDVKSGRDYVRKGHLFKNGILG